MPRRFLVLVLTIALPSLVTCGGENQRTEDAGVLPDRDARVDAAEVTSVDGAATSDAPANPVADADPGPGPDAPTDAWADAAPGQGFDAATEVGADAAAPAPPDAAPGQRLDAATEVGADATAPAPPDARSTAWSDAEKCEHMCQSYCVHKHMCDASPVDACRMDIDAADGGTCAERAHLFRNVAQAQVEACIAAIEAMSCTAFLRMYSTGEGVPDVCRGILI
jgi:hypothetical protein